MEVHLRPRVLLLVEEAPDTVRAELARRLHARVGELEGRVASHQVLAWVAGEQRRLWSPCLEITCRPHPRGTVVVGRLGPHMFLFSAMIFCFIGTGLVALLSLCFALVTWSLGGAPTALLGVIPLFVALAGFGLLDWLGRHRAHGQMVALARLLSDLGSAVVDEEGVLREAEALRQRRAGV